MAVVNAIATRTIQKKLRDLEWETFLFYREQVVDWSIVIRGDWL